uniref:Scavenger receptor class F member 2 n=2 Tax=Magallana gigas TaxID=29159 RepID=A0A8W8NWE7_MAGGI
MYPLICHDLGFLGLLPMLFNMLDVTEAYDNVALHMPSYQSYPDYNNYAENDLCEVEVYGCPTVNPDCDEWDPMMCACLVCKPSYMYIEPQHETTDWPIGSYGYYYDEMCGHCKDPTQCSPYTGICLTGCSAGYFGPSCKEECHIGNYGYNCNETCGHCKDLSQCSTTSGFCHTGCSYGYTGGLCKKKCDIGLYGDLCYDTCGHCIDPAECNHVTGTCRTGCAAGFRGHCDIGQYGHNCNETCGHCNNATQCSTVTGTCRTGCEAGYIGRLCKDVDQEKVMAISSLYGLIGVICFLVIIIGAQVLYIVLTRISIARNNARQQQNKEMVPAVYNDTFDAFDNKGCNIEYMEIGEPSYINTNARGLV